MALEIDGADWHYPPMSTYISVMKKIEDYARSHGVSTSTVCRNATGNARLMVRMQRRIGQLDTDVARLEAYMAGNEATSLEYPTVEKDRSAGV